MLVLLQSADIGLVDLGLREFHFLPGLVERLAQPVRQVPRRFLGYGQITVKVHRGNPLESGGREVNGDRPCLVAQLRSFHDVSGPETEHRPTVALAATVGHRSVPDAGLDVIGTAVRANRAVRPDPALEPFPRRLIIREHLYELGKADAFAEMLAGCLGRHLIPSVVTLIWGFPAGTSRRKCDFGI